MTEQTRRQQLIQRARAAILSIYGTDSDKFLDATSDDIAAAVVDALLPQITDAEQLSEMPEATVVLDNNGKTWRHVYNKEPGPGRLPSWWMGPGLVDIETCDTLLIRGPLTVVYQP